MTAVLTDVSLENPPEKDDPYVGRSVADRYVIERMLGDGAMGVVYRAQHAALERTVAIKILRSEYSHNELVTTRFAREARAASRLDHPNIVRVFDYGVEPDGLLFIALEFVEGPDLATLIHEQGPLPTARIANILSQILAALTVAHEAGIVHRDIKPENILIQQRADEKGQLVDFVKVCDFGIALLHEDPANAGAAELSHLTGNLIIGTPAYMSPEQARGEVLDARSDIYSVGLVTYQMLCAQLPFDDSSPFAIAFKQIHEEPAPPSASAEVDANLEALCLRALRKNPAERFQNAREMRLALRAAGFSDQTDLPMVVSLGRVDRPTLNVSNDSEQKTLSSRRPSRTSKRPASGQAIAARRFLKLQRSLWAIALLAVALELLWWLNQWTTSTHEKVAAGLSRPTKLDPPKPTELVWATPKGDPIQPTTASARTESNHRKPIDIARANSNARVSPAALTAPGASNMQGPLQTLPPATAGTASNMVGPLQGHPNAPDSVPVESRTASSGARPQQIPTAMRTGITAQAVAPKFDLAAATVRIGQATNVQGATTMAMNRALNGIETQLIACYRAALPSLTGTIAGPAMLHVETDGTGRITTASLAGPLGRRLTSCASSAARARRVANVDTGTARGDVPIIFQAR